MSESLLLELQEIAGDFWEREGRRLQAIIQPRIEAMAVAGADLGLARMASVGIAFDNSLAHAAAVRWAREFTDRYLRDEFNLTTQNSVGDVVAGWAETPGATLEDLDAALKPILDGNEIRAKMFATTESTRAFSKGEVASYVEAGLPRTVIEPPDNDVNCRCWVTPVRLPNGDWVIIWQTVRDTHVRKDEKAVPWGGTVKGHKGLHNVVISEGPYLGMRINDARAEARRRG